MTTALIEERSEGAVATLRRGLRMMPEFRRGLPVTFALALLATAGRVVVPIAVQQTIDRGLLGPGAPTSAWCAPSCWSARWSSWSPPPRSTA